MNYFNINVEQDDLIVVDLYNTLIRNNVRKHPYIMLYNHLKERNPTFYLSSKEFFNFSMKNKMPIIDIIFLFQLKYDKNILNNFYTFLDIEFDSIVYNTALINFLNSLNNKKVILSNLSFEYSKPIDNLASIFDFDKSVLSFNVSILKPNPQIFSYASSLYNKHTSECIMIGDNFHLDIDGSLKAGYKNGILIEKWWK